MSSAPTLQTVLGRVAISDGHALMHEHLAVGWLGHHLDPLAHRQREQELELVVRTLRELRERYHVSVVVDAAPADLGRDVALQARAAEASGVQVIAATGFDKLGRGLPFYFQQFNDEELEAFLVGELEDGVEATGIRCGVIKLGSTGVALSPQEVRTFTAGARVSARLGRAIITHTDPDGWETDDRPVGLRQLDVLLAAGADPRRIAIGHACGALTAEPLIEICRTGAHVAIDRVGLERWRTDAHRAGLVTALIDQGFAERVLLSHDAQVVWRDRHPHPPRSLHRIYDEFLPKHVRASSEITAMLMRDNPLRLLAV